MITRTHMTAFCLALAAATTSCRSNAEDAASDASAQSAQNTSAGPSAPASVAKPAESAGPSAPAAAAKPAETAAPAAAAKPAEATKPKSDGMQVAKIGAAAPAFVLKDLDGKEHSLAQYKGKTVVLEWFNPHCPVCIGAYTEGSLKGMPERYMADGIVWLGINSGSPESKSNGDANRPFIEKHNLKAPLLVDTTGAVGMSYGAKTTPHMYVIDPKGVLVYAGAIDSKQAGGELVNYVDAAIADMKAGKPVKTSETKAYGCNVKYGKPQ